MKLTTKRLKQLIREELSRMNETYKRRDRFNADVQQGEGRLQRALQNLGRVNMARGIGKYVTREPEDPRSNYIEVLVDDKLVAWIYNNGSVQIASDEQELKAEFNKSATDDRWGNKL